MTDWRTEDQLTFADLGLWSGKMSEEPTVRELQREQISKQSSKKSQESSAKKLPLFLSLKMDGQKADASAEWVTAAAPFPSLGDYTMPSFGESPSEENESRLSQILEDSPLPKYSLSAKACVGILNRAKRRGKELPKELKMALERQAYPSRNEPESLEAAKEFSFSVNTPEPCQLSTTSPSSQNKQTAYGISSFDSNAMKSSNPYSGIYEADASRTLDLNGGSPACNQGGIAIVCPIEGNGTRESHRGPGFGNDGDPSFTLNAVERHGASVVYGIDQQGGKGGANYTEDIAPTLAGDSHGTPHGVAIPINTMVGTRTTAETRTTFGVGEDGDPQFTLSSAHEHAVFTDVGVNKCLNPWDVQSKHIQPPNGVAESLYAGECRYGGGESYVLAAGFKAGQSKDGGLGYAKEQAPTLSATPSALEPTVVVAGFSYGQSEHARSLGYQEEVSPTLRSGEGGNQKPVVFAVDCRNGTENECINGTLQAKEQGSSLNLNNVVRVSSS